MKYLMILLLFISTGAMAGSSYSSADQDTELNEKGNHLDNGYSTKEAEEEDVEFSGEMNNGQHQLPTKHPTPEEQQDNSFPEDRNDLNY